MFRTFAMLVVVLFANGSAICLAQKPLDKSPYQAVGAPQNPQVVAHWNRYHDTAEATALLQQLAKAHPDRARLESLGKSYGGREMWLLTISNFQAGKGQAPHTPADERPAFWIDGGIHANEIQAVEVVLYTAWFLLEAYAQSPTIQKLLDERTFYLLPMMSPDSRDAHFYRPNSTHSPRSGQRPVDDDLDGLVDEDGPDDLDGDGHLTTMRVRDPNGKWKSHPDFPHWMVHVKAGEKGEYTLLGTEGFDNDGDGQVNEDGEGFYDPNRNWAWNWQPGHVQLGAHRYPFSIGENRLVADFIRAHPNIAGAQSYHNAGGMILRGPGGKTDRYESDDVRVYDLLGKKGEEMLPGYRYLNVATQLYEVWGGEFDWLHQMGGVFTFTNELFSPRNFFHRESGDGYFAGDETQRLFDKYLLLGDGFVPWHEVNHPQYGKIEVGGVKKTWLRQPPTFLLEEECHRNMAFTLYHADQMPLVRVQAVDVQSLGGDLRQITAIVENQRLIPTHSAGDVHHKITSPDIVTLTSPDAQFKVVTALTSREPFFRQPAEQKRQPDRVRLATIPGQSVVYVRWLVQGAGPVTVGVRSVKGGQHTMEVGSRNDE